MRELEVRIEKIVAGGDGLGRVEGRVVFVPDTAPGERHVVQVVEERKDYWKARSIRCLDRSRVRQDPPCPYQERCGGCALMHITPEAQLEVKTSILADCLTRSLGAPYQGPLRTHRRESAGYRNRLRFHVDFSGPGPLAGFRRRASEEVVDVERCLLGSETLNEVWRRVRAKISERRLFAHSVVSVELEESSSETGRIAARFFVSTIDALRKLDSTFWEELRASAGLEGVVVEVARGGPVQRFGHASVRHRVSGLALEQTVGSFFQSNRFLLQELVDCVVASVPAGTPRALDLYCGVGLFSLPLASRASSVFGVESETLAVRDARANAAEASLENVRFLREDVEKYVRGARLRKDDAVVVDPPRGGMSRALVDALGTSPIDSLRYVSCDAPALARDARRLRQHGLTIASLDLFDLFPHTHHFETVAVFARPAPAGRTSPL
jgi:23S rRNA (uracil1939-C5)-methyltransferase